jgi:hypothetical protein
MCAMELECRLDIGSCRDQRRGDKRFKGETRHVERLKSWHCQPTI